jgi:hypothetical protein
MSSEKVPGKRKYYVSIESPDPEVTIDFLGFSPERGAWIEGATIKIKLTYDRNTGTANLEMYAQDNSDNKIVFDTVEKLHVAEAAISEDDPDGDDE